MFSIHQSSLHKKHNLLILLLIINFSYLYCLAEYNPNQKTFGLNIHQHQHPKVKSTFLENPQKNKICQILNFYFFKYYFLLLTKKWLQVK